MLSWLSPSPALGYPHPKYTGAQQPAAIPHNRCQAKRGTILATQLISALLPLPYTLSHLDQFKVLFRRLKDVKEYYPIAIR